MSDSWRYNIQFDNRTGKVLADRVSGIGATVISSSRGTLEPVYFNAGETGRVIELLGEPTPIYKDVLEVIEYNKKYPIWVSAPDLNGRHGGVFVGASGSTSLYGGTSTVPDDDSFDIIEVIELISTGDGSVSSFGITLEGKTYYNNQTIDIYVDGTAENISATDVAIEVLTGDNGSGTYNRSTGALSYTFDSAPTTGQRIEARYTVNLSAVAYFGLFSRAPQADYLAIKLSYDEDTELFSLYLYEKDSLGNYTLKEDYPIEFSLTEGTVDGFGNDVYIDTVLEDHDFLVPVTNGDLTFSTFSDDSSQVDLDGGYRGDSITATEYTTGYDEFKEVSKYNIDIFWDNSANSAVPTAYVDLKTNYFKYSTRFICATANVAVATAIASGVPVSNRGISFNYNWGYVRNAYSNYGNVWSALIGEVASKHADIMVNAYGGLAPAWIDENGMGGQLTSGRIIKMAYYPTEVQLQALDTARFNAIIYTKEYGPLISSRRTSISTLSDFSYIDYVGAIEYIIKNVQTQVLPYQIVKLNDDVHRAIVASKTESIIAPMTTPPVNVIREYLVKCDSENNNDAVLAQEKFKLGIAIKVTPKSRTIEVVVVNTPQGADITEQFI